MSNEVKAKTFRCEVVTVAAHGANFESLFAKGIEDAYQRLNDEALMDNMVIVDQRQLLTDFFFPDGEIAGLCLVITAHRINRHDLAEAQMRSQLMGQSPPAMGRS